MATYSRAACMLLEEGSFWLDPKDAEHWSPAVSADAFKHKTAAEVLQFVKDRGFPG